jgi:uncharacterized protein (DUF342 family)
MSVAAKLMQISDAVHVVVSEDGFKAFLTFMEGSDAIPCSAHEIQALLAEHGVIHGVRTDLADVVAHRAPNERSILVAVGKPPQAGKSGWIDYCFNTNQQSADSSKERKVDYHDLGWIHNVHKLVVIAELHPAEAGIPGIRISGDEVPPPPVKEPVFKLGSGVALDPSNHRKVIATVDGNAVLEKDGTLHVHPTITVTGNVDYATGDIDFVGSVMVFGDVKSDFTIKAGQSVEIRGNVEDATIEAGGDVIVRKGFLGQGKGLIKAGGNVEIQHVLNQSVVSKKLIRIMREGICAKLHASEKIAAPSAVFVGCTLEAGDEIDVHNLGNGDQTQAKVRVGRRGILFEQMSRVDREFQKAQRQLAEAKNAVYRLVRMQLDNGKLTAEQDAFLTKLKLAQTELTKVVERLQKDAEDLKGQMRETGVARIVVRDTIHANVFVELNGVKKMMQGAIKEVILTEKDGAIEERPLE